MRLKQRITIAFFLFSVVAFSQGYSSQEQGVIDEARSFYEVGDYLMTWDLLYPLAARYPNDTTVNYLMGMSGRRIEKYKPKSAQYLKWCVNHSVEGTQLPYAETLLHLDRPYEAKEFLAQALEAGEDSARIQLIQSHCENAIAAFQNETPVVVERLGSEINSDFIEHTPLVSLDDSLLFFTSRRPLNSKSITDFRDEYDENIYYSVKGANGWMAAKPLPGRVNKDLNDATVALRPDAEELMVFKTSRDLESSDLYLARKKRGKWKVKEKLEAPLNSRYIENSAAYNAQGNVFYVSSDRPGGYGGFDIYRIVRFANGDLSQPLNLGPEINTPYDEIAPFILPDNQTLYYSSNGPESMGGFDIFKAQNQQDMAWKAPENLGYPLNTTRDDLHVSISWNGGRAYYSRSKPDHPGDFDICRSNLPGFNMNANVYRIHITNRARIEGLQITLYTEDYTEALGYYNTNENGNMILVLFPGERGVFRVEAEGHEAYERMMDFRQQDGIYEIPMDITLKRSQ